MAEAHIQPLNGLRFDAIIFDGFLIGTGIIMASEAPTLSGSSADNLTPAQRLAEKHDDHKPTVEEVVDEED
ncbi:hypothetical protein KCU90_g19264, partial [Aureobasidium melanogenum]